MGRKVTKKNEHTQVSSLLFAKKIDSSICNRLLQHNRSLLIIVYATVIAKGVTDFANNCEQLKYGLHLDAVISRWACEHANEVGALDVTKKKRYIQIYRKFYSLFINLLFPAHKITTFPPSLQLFSQKKLSTASPPYALHLTPAAPLPINPPSSTKKGG